MELNENARRILSQRAEYLRTIVLPQGKLDCDDLAERLQGMQESLARSEQEYLDLVAVLAAEYTGA
jgi:hypothetical protein